MSGQAYFRLDTQGLCDNEDLNIQGATSSYDMTALSQSLPLYGEQSKTLSDFTTEPYGRRNDSVGSWIAPGMLGSLSESRERSRRASGSSPYHNTDRDPYNANNGLGSSFDILEDGQTDSLTSPYPRFDIRNNKFHDDFPDPTSSGMDFPRENNMNLPQPLIETEPSGSTGMSAPSMEGTTTSSKRSRGDKRNEKKTRRVVLKKGKSRPTKVSQGISVLNLLDMPTESELSSHPVSHQRNKVSSSGTRKSARTSLMPANEGSSLNHEQPTPRNSGPFSGSDIKYEINAEAPTTQFDRTAKMSKQDPLLEDSASVPEDLRSWDYLSPIPHSPSPLLRPKSRKKHNNIRKDDDFDFIEETSSTSRKPKKQFPTEIGLDPSKSSPPSISGSSNIQSENPVTIYLSEKGLLDAPSNTEDQTNGTTSSPDNSIDSDMLSISDRSEHIDPFGMGKVAGDVLTDALHRLLQEWQVEKTRQYAPGRSNQPATALQHQSLDSSSSSRQNARIEKRKRNAVKNDGNESDDNEGSPPPNKTRASSGLPRKLFACPYWKKEPMKYRDCFSKKLSRIRDVKQHLMRRHTPEFYCQRCLESFKDKDNYHNHVMAESPCQANITGKLDGISSEQQKALHKKSKHGVTDAQQWYSIWHILFVDYPEPDSPYMDFEQSLEFSEWVEFCQYRGPEIVAEEINSRFEQISSIPEADRVPEMFRIAAMGFRSALMEFRCNWSTTIDLVRQGPTTVAGNVSSQLKPSASGTSEQDVSHVINDDLLLGHHFDQSFSDVVSASWLEQAGSSTGQIRPSDHPETELVDFDISQLFGTASDGDIGPFEVEFQEPTRFSNDGTELGKITADITIELGEK